MNPWSPQSKYQIKYATFVSWVYYHPIVISHFLENIPSHKYLMRLSRKDKRFIYSSENILSEKEKHEHRVSKAEIRDHRATEEADPVSDYSLGLGLGPVNFV